MDTYHAASWSDPYSSSDEEEICRYMQLLAGWVLFMIDEIRMNSQGCLKTALICHT